MEGFEIISEAKYNTDQSKIRA
ncbi:uncharacterized protein G2W53_023247 [Senna tora]|uniref:Uncharacterized protein n=1 Tax=Senna tora TaxID=362788 RepID=A0A834WCR4_9FABA|nr:uncharacterized protein G2W53_023247 [Senna tora]